MRWFLAAACIGMALGGGAALAHPGGKLTNPDYVGKGQFDPRMKVAFSVDHRSSGASVRFEASNVRSACDDGTHERLDFNVFRAPLDEHNQFERIEYSRPSGSDDSQSIYWFRGRLVDDGRHAKGFVFDMFDPYDPPDGSNLAECSTLARLRWKAARAR